MSRDPQQISAHVSLARTLPLAPFHPPPQLQGGLRKLIFSQAFCHPVQNSDSVGKEEEEWIVFATGACGDLQKLIKRIHYITLS